MNDISEQQTEQPAYLHIPVLLAEVQDAFQPQAGGRYIDCTVGGGGHAAALLGQIQPGGHLLGMDADPAALCATQARFLSSPTLATGSYTLVHGTFDNLSHLATTCGFHAVDGILFDLGVSSHQLDTPERGFSFQTDAPLDMRLDPTQGETAATLIARLSERDLADILYHYGEERFSRRIARRIVERRQQRPVETTGELATLVAQATPHRKGAAQGKRHALHPATRTFQALRIAVNQELQRLETALPQAVGLLRPGGKLVVISFHSLEDRIVKQFFRSESGYGGSEAESRAVRLRIITRKPLVAGEKEVGNNPRSRSAKLRVAERV